MSFVQRYLSTLLNTYGYGTHSDLILATSFAHRGAALTDFTKQLVPLMITILLYRVVMNRESRRLAPEE